VLSSRPGVRAHFLHMIQGALQRQGGEHYCTSLEETARNERYRDAKSLQANSPSPMRTFRPTGRITFITPDERARTAGNGRSDARRPATPTPGCSCIKAIHSRPNIAGRIFHEQHPRQASIWTSLSAPGPASWVSTAPDFINFNDRWSQIINLLTGPDGSVFMIDWYDKNKVPS